MKHGRFGLFQSKPIVLQKVDAGKHRMHAAGGILFTVTL
jgi:hypothetical protein